MNIIIKSNNDFTSSWQAFATWFSCKRFYPDIDYHILVKNYYLYGWAKKVNAIQKSLSEPYLVLSNHWLLLRELPFANKLSDEEQDLVFINSKTKELWLKDNICFSSETKCCPLVRLENKIGKFDLDLWKTQDQLVPFYYTNMFRNNKLTLNDELIINIWEEMGNLFGALCKN